MCASRFKRIPREVRGDAGGEAAQNRARRFPDQASLPRKCRARFTALRRASPLSFEAGTVPRTANRETGVVCASRGLRLAASAILV